MFSFGNRIRMTLFGASHDKCVGVAVDGLPAGFAPDFAAVETLLARRRASAAKASTSRIEADTPEIVSGLFDGKTTGAPLVATFANANTQSGDYRPELPRPGHSDYPAFVKYGESHDYRGGGFFSGRMTVGMCFAGALALQLLAKRGITVAAHAKIHGDVAAAAVAGDSVGGTVSCVVSGVPAGLGNPIFGSVEAVLSAAMFAIPAVKAIEFGVGAEAARLKGSQNNDAYYFDGKAVRTRTNNCGGILGGITNGMPVEFCVAIKPTPSISIEQDTVNLKTGENAKLAISGRHDVCIVPRVLPVIEAMAAFALLDVVMGSAEI